jgi:glycosyltransferase involved in cell wall biosynthesis
LVDLNNLFYERLALQKEYGGNDKPINKVIPLVSVGTTTYQQVLYIRQCLDSILTQKTDFPFEIVIGEDGSTDGTREICIEYADKYPEKIRLFLRNRDISHYFDPEIGHITFNGVFLREEMRGKYIAICEGDDYWIDDTKLAKQSKILKNKKYAMCMTSYNILINKTVVPVVQRKDEYSIRDMIKSNIASTVTVMYKAIYKPRFTPEIASFWFKDWTLWLSVTKNGKIFNLKDLTANYRVNIGVTKSTLYEKKYKDFLKMYAYIKTDYYNYKNAIETGEAIIALNYAKYLIREKKYNQAREMIFISILKKVSSETVFNQILCILMLNTNMYNSLKKVYGLCKSAKRGIFKILSFIIVVDNHNK